MLTLSAADGSTLDLVEDDILVQRQEKQGMSVANEGDITVALDTQLTPALIQEGWAREIVSQLQSLRKDSGLEVVLLGSQVPLSCFSPTKVPSFWEGLLGIRRLVFQSTL